MELGKNRSFIMMEKRKHCSFQSIMKDLFMMSIGIKNTLLSNAANKKMNTGI